LKGGTPISGITLYNEGMDFNTAIIRIFAAFFLGALIGLERELTQKSAGLRTHILVTVGSAIFTIISVSCFLNGIPSWEVYFSQHPNRMIGDPSRVAAQVVSGIGFIGGGALLKHGASIKGLTTAAGLWVMASIGMLVGIGHIKLAVFSTILIFITLFSIGKIERLFFTKHVNPFNRIRVQITAEQASAGDVQQWVDDHFSQLMIEAKIRTMPEHQRVEIAYVLDSGKAALNVNAVSSKITNLSGVLHASINAYYDSEM
jgi:putative Mg2+ transporter-C (MgtC) family protein